MSTFPPGNQDLTKALQSQLIPCALMKQMAVGTGESPQSPVARSDKEARTRSSPEPQNLRPKNPGPST